MEEATTFLLVMLFVPDFKYSFSGSLLRHYRDLVLFPSSLPFPLEFGSVRSRGAARVAAATAAAAAQAGADTRSRLCST